MSYTKSSATFRCPSKIIASSFFFFPIQKNRHVSVIDLLILTVAKKADMSNFTFYTRYLIQYVCTSFSWYYVP